MDSLLIWISVASQWVWDRAEKVGNLSQLATALVAAIAIGLAYSQIKSARRAQREATAHELIRTLFQNSLSSPHFYDPTIAQINYDTATIDGDKREFAKYAAYVNYSLYVYEQILDLRIGNNWDIALRETLLRHRDYLQSSYFKTSGGANSYSKRLQNKISRTL
jgi:hypothetical protein